MTHTSSRFADYMAEPDRAIPHMRRDGAWAPLRAARPRRPVPGRRRLLDRRGHGEVDDDGARAGRGRRRAADPGRGALAGADAAVGLRARPRRRSTGRASTATASTSGSRRRDGRSSATPAPSTSAPPPASTSCLRPTSASSSSATPSRSARSRRWRSPSPTSSSSDAVTRDWLATLDPALRPHVGTRSARSPAPSPRPRPTPAAPDADYLGTYANDYFGAAEVARAGEGGGLVLTLGPARVAFRSSTGPATPSSSTPRGENAPDGSRSAVTFVRDGDKAVAMTVEFLDENGLGTFRS